MKKPRTCKLFTYHQSVKKRMTVSTTVRNPHCNNFGKKTVKKLFGVLNASGSPGSCNVNQSAGRCVDRTWPTKLTTARVSRSSLHAT